MRFFGLIYMALGACAMAYALLTMPWNLHPFNPFILLLGLGFAVFVAGLTIWWGKRQLDTKPRP